MTDAKTVTQEWVNEYVALRDSVGSPVAWRSREKGSSTWRLHTIEPSDVLLKYAVAGLGGYEIEPLYALPSAFHEAPLKIHAPEYIPTKIVFGQCVCLRPDGYPLGNCEECVRTSVATSERRS